MKAAVSSFIPAYRSRLSQSRLRFTTSRSRWLQFALLLIFRRHFRRDLGRRLRVSVELLPVGAPPVSDRVQRGGVFVQLRFRYNCPDLGQPSILLGTEDLTSARTEVAHHVSQHIIRSPDLHVHQRLE